MDQSVTLPAIAWEALLDILGSHTLEHGDYDFTTIVNIYNEITDQTKVMK